MLNKARHSLIVGYNVALLMVYAILPWGRLQFASGGSGNHVASVQKPALRPLSLWSMAQHSRAHRSP